MMKTTYHFFLFFIVFLFSADLHAQSNKALVGDWVVVARKGHDPCAIDVQLKFLENGAVSILIGQQFEQCSKTTNTYPAWDAGKHSRMTDTGWDKFDAIKLINAEGKVAKACEVFVFVGDFMKIKIPLKIDDEYQYKTFIFKKKV